MKLPSRKSTRRSQETDRETDDRENEERKKTFVKDRIKGQEIRLRAVYRGLNS